jgi:hypothetical protein
MKWVENHVSIQRGSSAIHPSPLYVFVDVFGQSFVVKFRLVLSLLILQRRE